MKVHSRIAKDPRFTPYFDNYIGALDRTHIHTFPGIKEQAPFRNRKGFLSHNVLTTCTFDLQFYFVYPR
jgi:hypothetical protein